MAIQVDLLTIIAIRTHTFKVAVFWMRSLVYFKASLIPCQMAKKIFYAAEREREREREKKVRECNQIECQIYVQGFEGSFCARPEADIVRNFFS